MVDYQGQMCPAGRALHRPAANLLFEYATIGCPMRTGMNWSIQDTEAAIKVGHHICALNTEALKQLQVEVSEKEMKGQAWVVL